MKLYEVEKLDYEKRLKTKAWVRYIRKSSKVVFLQCYDGTTSEDIQMVLSRDKLGDLSRGDYISVDACKVESRGTQDFELQIEEYLIVSKPEKYPIEKRDSSVETLREIPQYRTKVRKQAVVMKLRSKLERYISEYFDEKCFCKITPPLITPSDCEGAGEVFSLGDDFFKKEAYLTVSSQMYLEAMTRSFSQVYCLAPAFRADPSLSPRHLAEFWMLEVEIISKDMRKVIQESLSLIQYIGESLLKEKSLLDEIDKELYSRIEKKVKEDVRIISYKEAKDILGKEIKGSVEEKELMEILGSSIVLTDFPIEQKPFYMKREGEYTKSFDVLLRGIGEVVGGSMREESKEILSSRISKSLQDTLSWYLDMRDVDRIQTGGFGLGFDRILMYYLELDSIKESITFPRWFERLDL